jgi:hypothetical protein
VWAHAPLYYDPFGGPAIGFKAGPEAGGFIYLGRSGWVPFVVDVVHKIRAAAAMAAERRKNEWSSVQEEKILDIVG